MSKIAPTLQIKMERMQPEDKVWVIIFLYFQESKNLEDALGVNLPKDHTEYRKELIEKKRQDMIAQTKLTFYELWEIVGYANTKTTYLNPTMICRASKKQIEKVAQVKGVTRIVDDAQLSAEMLL